jgi:hypothetical protein
MPLKNNDQFQNDFMNKYGINLQTVLTNYHFLGGDNNQKHLLFSERAEQMVLLKIGEYNPRFKLEKASEFQLEKIWEASLEQAFFMLMTGDTTLISGFDPVSGNLVSYEEIRKRQFSDVAYKILLQAGLLYAGLDSTRRSVHWL